MENSKPKIKEKIKRRCNTVAEVIEELMGE